MGGCFEQIRWEGEGESGRALLGHEGAAAAGGAAAEGC